MAATTIARAPRTKKMTAEAYFAFEEKSDVRHEFDNGKLIAMPETTDFHNEICGNIYLLLRQLLAGTDYKVYKENVKLGLLEGEKYVYPDIFVTNSLVDAQNHLVKRHPKVIFEVLSDSTRVYDRTEKFAKFKKLPAFQHYILVESEKMIVEHHFKNEKNQWESRVYREPFDQILIPALGIMLTLGKIYNPF